LPFFKISAVTGEGVTPLLEAAWPHIHAARTADAAARALVEEASEPAPDYNPALVPPLTRRDSRKR
jgi:hypothetical protein